MSALVPFSVLSSRLIPDTRHTAILYVQGIRQIPQAILRLLLTSRAASCTPSPGHRHRLAVLDSMPVNTLVRHGAGEPLSVMTT
jgi:hypothetical protein